MSNPSITIPHARWNRTWSKMRSEEHTSELQSLRHLVCRLLLEKKKKNRTPQAQTARRLEVCVEKEDYRGPNVEKCSTRTTIRTTRHTVERDTSVAMRVSRGYL